MADGRWQAPRASMLDPFKPYLDQRAGEGCSNAAQLFREITGLGYTGSCSTVRDYLDQHRPAAGPTAQHGVTGGLKVAVADLARHRRLTASTQTLTLRST
jgi:hypothetical protein